MMKTNSTVGLMTITVFIFNLFLWISFIVLLFYSIIGVTLDYILLWLFLPRKYSDSFYDHCIIKLNDVDEFLGAYWR